MKIAVDIGHNCGMDSGAVDIGNENIMNMETGKKLIDLLKSCGYDILNVTPDFAESVGDSLSKRVNLANNWGADCYISIHANSGGGSGTEIWIGSENGRKLGEKICDEISTTLNYYNRGVKLQGIDGPHLYVLRYTNMPAILIEQCFVDNKVDMDKWNPEKMSRAIAKGLTGKSDEIYPKIDHSILESKYIVWKSPNGLGYIESVPEKGRINFHLDRFNYVSIQDDEEEGNRMWITTRKHGVKFL